MQNEKKESGTRQIFHVTYLGLFINIALAAIKIVIGTLAHSMSLIADGIHSVSDLATDAAVLLGVSFGSKEPDLQHPYGHGRIETFTGAVIALF